MSKLRLAELQSHLLGTGDDELFLPSDLVEDVSWDILSAALGQDTAEDGGDIPIDQHDATLFIEDIALSDFVSSVNVGDPSLGVISFIEFSDMQASSVLPGTEIAFQQFELRDTTSPNMPHQFETDLTFLDFTPFAKPSGAGGGKPDKGDGGGNNGGGRGGGKNKDPDPTPDPEPTPLTGYTSGPEDGYNIELDFQGSWTLELQDAFIWAADLISTFITTDISDVFYQGQIIDDLLISSTLTAIDGSGGVLGQAGPTAIRTADSLPATAIMEFDSADAQDFYDLGLWDDIVLHEMLHSVGVGTIWDRLELIGENEAGETIFLGDLATASNGGDILIETDGGPGTALGHWDEATYDNELLTGYINNNNDLAAFTVASLGDLGYAIDLNSYTSDIV